jgi:hypothetical protein
MKALRVLFFAALALQVSFATPAVTNLQFYKIAPCRLVDTRWPTGPYGSPSLQSGTIRHFALHGSNAPACGVPPTARAAALNAAIVYPDGDGHITIWEYNLPMPGTSNMNFRSGQVTSNGALATVSLDPTWQIDVFAAVGGGGHADFILDVTGYYE